MSKRARRITIPGVTGINSRQERGAAPFQPGQGEGGGWRPLALVQCENAVVADDGAVLALPAAERIDGADGVLALHAAPCGLLLQRAGSLWRLGDDAPLVAEVSASVPIQFQSHQGLVYWSDDSHRGRITSAGLNLPWALPAAPTPAITLVAASAGAGFPPGRYLVSTTWIDPVGAESGCAPSAAVELATSGQALQLDPGPAPAEADAVRVYVSLPNDPQPALLFDWPLADGLPIPIAQPLASDDPRAEIVLRTQGLTALPSGAGMTTRGGYLLTWAGDLLWYSVGAWSHLCDQATNLFQMPAPILGAVGLDGGVWVTTTAGVVWIAGADLAQASVALLNDGRHYASGGVRVSAELALGVQTGRDVALFVSDEGLVVGTADGQLLAPLRAEQLWAVAGRRGHCVPWVYAGAHYLLTGVH